MSQAGPEKRRIKAMCEPRLLQSSAQAPGQHGSKDNQASRELKGAMNRHDLNPTPSLHGRTYQLAQIQAEGWT
jgi:hypothetical protein